MRATVRTLGLFVLTRAPRPPSLPPCHSGELGAHTRVPGCISVVHVLAQMRSDGTLALAGAADSRLARGLVALLVRGLRGESVSTLRSLRASDLADAAGISELVTPSRLNGVAAMLRLMCEQLGAADAAIDPDAAKRSIVGAQSAPTSVGESAEPPTAPLHPHLAWPAAEQEVALLLSGGVDSSVALHQLLSAGHRVRAFYLRIWLEVCACRVRVPRVHVVCACRTAEATMCAAPRRLLISATCL